MKSQLKLFNSDVTNVRSAPIYICQRVFNHVGVNTSSIIKYFFVNFLIFIYVILCKLTTLVYRYRSEEIIPSN